VWVIAQSRLRAFWEQHADAEKPLRAWHAEAEAALWTSPAQAKAQYRNASVLQKGRIVFNIAGNKYRLVVQLWNTRVYVRFIGTHQEYDAIDAQTI
jgi:mRNA interferase HigB